MENRMNEILDLIETNQKIAKRAMERKDWQEFDSTVRDIGFMASVLKDMIYEAKNQVA